MNLKKSLVATAVAAAMAVPAVSFASDATLYGRLAMSVQSISALTDNTHGQMNFASGPWSGSYLGVKGNDQGNNGLSTFYNVQLGYSALGSSSQSYGFGSGTNQSNNFYTRLAYLGVHGNFGTVVAGRVDDLFYKFVNEPTDPTLQVLSGMGPAGMADQYWVNALAYVSPTFDGFTGAVAAGNFGTTNNTNEPYTNDTVYEAAGSYKWNQLTIGAAAMYLPRQANGQRPTLSFTTSQQATYGLPSTKVTTLGLSDFIRSAYGVSASYNLGMFNVAGSFEHTNANHTTLGAYNLEKLMSINTWTLVGNTSMGALSGYLLYTGSKSAESGSKTAQRWAAGVFYNITKPMQVGFELAWNNKTATAVDGDAANQVYDPVGYVDNSGYKASTVASVDMTYWF